jgi:hypothetical protein
MQVRICDRCKAPASALELATTRRTLVIPQADLSTLPVPADVEISMGVEVQADLCFPCFASTLLEYAIVALGGRGVLTPAVVLRFIARLQAAVAAAAKTAADAGMGPA